MKYLINPANSNAGKLLISLCCSGGYHHLYLLSYLFVGRQTACISESNGMLEKVNPTKLSYKAFQSENTNKSWLVLLHLVRYQGRVDTQSLRAQQGCHRASRPVWTLVDAKRARFKNPNQHLFLALSIPLPPILLLLLISFDSRKSTQCILIAPRT